jgi:hypothetical protein
MRKIAQNIDNQIITLPRFAGVVIPYTSFPFHFLTISACFAKKRAGVVFPFVK